MVNAGSLTKYPGQQLESNNKPLPRKSHTAAKNRWFLGKWSNFDAPTIMKDVYRVLKKFNFEWKVLSVYKLKARYPPQLLNKDGSSVHKNQIVKIGIQLYKTPRNLFVLDIQKLYGEMFLFMDACANLTTELKLTQIASAVSS